ncbi:hypothetical protein VTJ83DRAFT_2165 [Remersonia thermophila]|uniref:Homeobox domain-containing protein n=1 Tax=Remersonia thermophila TaxID=72144 RepID=A0ABR4DI75_9PEZI
MEFMDPYRRRYAAMTVQPFAGQPSAPQPPAQYPYWNVMAYYQHQHRAAALMGQGAMHLTKPAEPKPRLAKEEVELLEREFAKNQKPSSSTKRELAEQMGVEVPRINNWFQNRRAKEKQLKKTAEFEAQQARERAASEAKSNAGQEQTTANGTETDPASSVQDHQQGQGAESPDAHNHVSPTTEAASDPVSRSPLQTTAPAPAPAPALAPAPSSDSPSSSANDGFAHANYTPAEASSATAPDMSKPAEGPVFAGEFGETHPAHDGFQQQQQQQQQPHQTPFSYQPSEAASLNVEGFQQQAFSALTPRNNSVTALSDASGAFSPFSEHDYFAAPSMPQFPSDMVTAASTPAMHAESSNPLLRHETSMESLAHSDAVSPSSSIPDSPLTLANLRFKSPPPPADIASRRKTRRPAPLGLPALRAGGSGPKTGIEMPRRSDTVSPMRRISSATGLNGRIQKPFMPPGGPRSPFAMDRNKEALLQSLQENQNQQAAAAAAAASAAAAAAAASMPTLNSAMVPPPMSQEEMLASAVAESAIGGGGGGAHVLDDEQGPPYSFPSLSAVDGLPLYATSGVEPSTTKSPLGTPGLSLGFFQDSCFPGSLDNNGWGGYTQPDEPLPTPSLCSHGGSELEFSMAAPLPGYVASQPVTPSFPPPAVAAAAAGIGPAYGGFFGSASAPSGIGCGPTEYHFPDSTLSSSYPADRSSPLAPLRGPNKQFQFAQNITPQDFNAGDKQ